MSHPRFVAALLALTLAACDTLRERDAAPVPGVDAGPRITLYVIKRSWHTDIGFAADDLRLPLARLRPKLPAARYFLFGFGDRHYLMDHGSSTKGMVGAIWPGPGVVLVTGLAGSPEQAFGPANVIQLTLSTGQAQSLEEFIWNTFATRDGSASVLAAGPYDGSLYYAATTRYSGLHTCNTWTAEGLQSARLPVRSIAVELSAQVWRQVRKVARQQSLAAQPRALSR